MYMIRMGKSARDIEALFNEVLPNELLSFDKERIMWQEEKGVFCCDIT